MKGNTSDSRTRSRQRYSRSLANPSPAARPWRCPQTTVGASKLAAWLQQSIHYQKPQHLLPTHRLATLRQALLPKLTQPQLVPQFAPQPTVPERPRSPQFQAAQPHRHAVQHRGGNLPVLQEQTQGGVALFVLIEHLQRLLPSAL